eukprot:TRINITY_DN15418_c0_g1_i2.p1 TRINITY_DN15418_c0_g1~~TRINITY_DN15418_c0_g1_i2.p1  ORF type:complete len:245 (+),score=47.34 TRINITY_DN15418_c0_g1_i2:182-916(+)
MGIMCSQISTFHITSNFLKPLNPILGETSTGEFEDGSQYFAEQTFHHPPISHFMLFGTRNLYVYTGYANVAAHPGFNNIHIKVAGHRKLTFHDGITYIWNHPDEFFDSTFWGTPRHEAIGTLVYNCKQLNIEAYIELGEFKKKKPQDYFRGEIKKDGEVVSTIYGSYMGFLEFDGVRYWDAREIELFQMRRSKQMLPSDAIFRPDLQILATGNIDLAQTKKEELETLQRYDRKLRDQYSKKKQI